MVHQTRKQTKYQTQHQTRQIAKKQLSKQLSTKLWKPTRPIEKPLQPKAKIYPDDALTSKKKGMANCLIATYFGNVYDTFRDLSGTVLILDRPELNTTKLLSQIAGIKRIIIAEYDEIIAWKIGQAIINSGLSNRVFIVTGDVFDFMRGYDGVIDCIWLDLMTSSMGNPNDIAMDVRRNGTRCFATTLTVRTPRVSYHMYNTERGRRYETRVEDIRSALNSMLDMSIVADYGYRCSGKEICTLMGLSIFMTNDALKENRNCVFAVSDETESSIKVANYPRYVLNKNRIIGRNGDLVTIKRDFVKYKQMAWVDVVQPLTLT